MCVRVCVDDGSGRAMILDTRVHVNSTAVRCPRGAQVHRYSCANASFAGDKPWCHLGWHTLTSGVMKPIMPSCLPACLPVCLPACLPVCPSVCLRTCLHACVVSACVMRECVRDCVRAWFLCASVGACVNTWVRMCLSACAIMATVTVVEWQTWSCTRWGCVDGTAHLHDESHVCSWSYMYWPIVSASKHESMALCMHQAKAHNTYTYIWTNRTERIQQNIMHPFLHIHAYLDANTNAYTCTYMHAGESSRAQ